MPKDYELVLQGTRKEAEAALQGIRDELARNDSKDPKVAQFKFGVKVLHSLCQVLAKPKGVHTAIYCNIVVDVIGPCMQPEAGGRYWSSYLDCLLYIHYQFSNQKLYDLAGKLFALFRSIPNKLQSESDYKRVIDMCCQHLYRQRGYLQTAEAVVATEIMCGVLDELTALFFAMLKRNQELNFQYPNLLDVFMSQLILKHTAATFNFLASLPSAAKLCMFQAFLELLGKMKAPHPVDVAKQIQAHLPVLANFIQLDGTAKLEHKLALEHLRLLREASWVKCDEAGHYILSIMYYYVRSVYTTVKTNGLQETYVQMSAKLSSYLKRLKGCVRAKDEWFADFVVVMCRLQTQMQQKNPEVFSFFWQDINTVKCYKAHFELTLSLTQFAANMPNSELGKMSCCSSVRQHTTLSYGIAAVGAYSSFMLTTREPTAQADLQQLAELNRIVTQIFQTAVMAIGQLDCLTATASDLRLFYARFAQLTRDAVTPRQATMCVALGELLVPIKHKFERQDWTLLLRRIYKTAINTKNEQQAMDIHACYLAAALVNVETHGDSHYQLLQGQLSCYYACFANGTYKASSVTSVLELCALSSSVFKEPIQPAHKAMLLWLEMQHFFTYARSNVALQQSLMSLCTSEYDYVLLARGGKLRDVVVCSLKAMCSRYCASLEQGGVKRLERLNYAHACCLLLAHENEKEKTSREVDMNYCMEDQLATLLEQEGVRTVRLDAEIGRIKLAERALQAFEEFYKMSDAEPISADEALIDWEALLEDLGTLALYLQLAGFVDVATRAWLLHYRIANLVDDICSALRGLSFFCEYAHALQDTTDLCLETEVNAKAHLIWSLVQDLEQQHRRQQTWTLLCVCQLAYYQAYKGHLQGAMLLLKLVKSRHGQLAERAGRYDLVLASMDTVHFRIMWKQLDKVKGVPLAQRNLLCAIDELLENFRRIYVSSSDFHGYCILLFTIVQDTGECSANRMWDSAVYSFMTSVLKMALQMGCAFRAVQVISTWAMLNLQQEYVRKAELKLKLCEYFLCIATIDEVRKFIAARTPLEKPSGHLDMSFNELLAVSAIATMRKEAHHPSSPIKSIGQRTENLRLQKFLDYCQHNSITANENLQWCFFLLGSLNARLLYLVADYSQLRDFHERCHVWLQQRTPTLVLKCYQHYGFIQLRQHINYLRAIEREEESQRYIAIGLRKCMEAAREVDTVYYLNFRVQLMASQHQLRLGRRQLFSKPESPPTEELAQLKLSPPTTSAAVAQTPQAKSKIYPKTPKTPKITFAIYDCSPAETPLLSASQSTAKTPTNARKPSQARGESILRVPKPVKRQRGVVRGILEAVEAIEPRERAEFVAASPEKTVPKKTRGRPKKQGSSSASAKGSDSN